MIRTIWNAIRKLAVSVVGLVVAEDPDQNEEARQEYRDVRAGWKGR